MTARMMALTTAGVHRVRNAVPDLTLRNGNNKSYYRQILAGRPLRRAMPRQGGTEDRHGGLAGDQIRSG